MSSPSAAVAADTASADTASAPRITVVGAGVIGLTVALTLQRWGAIVTIRARTSPLTASSDSYYTSDKAGAHWFSFALNEGESRKQALDEITFYALLGLTVTEADSGVQIVRGHAFFEQADTTLPSGQVVPQNIHSLPWFSEIVPRFREWTSEQLNERAKEENGGVKYARAFSYETAMIHAPHYIKWLLQQFLAQGGLLLQGETLHSLSDAWLEPSANVQRVCQNENRSSSSRWHSPQVVVNCCGLGSAVLSDVKDSSMSPDRGQTILIHCPSITDICRVPSAESPTYILPRGDGTVVLGGTHIWGDDNLKPSEEVSRAILQRCARVLPLLRNPKNFTILEEKVGLRPGRGQHSTQQRIEIDEQMSSLAAARTSPSTPAPLVVHCYGHGGDGFQSSWGSALVVAHLIHSARPSLFAHRQKNLFHLRHAQQHTGLLERAIAETTNTPLTLPKAKL